MNFKRESKTGIIFRETWLHLFLTLDCVDNNCYAPKDTWETGISHMRRPPGELSPGVTGPRIISLARLRLGGQWCRLTAHVSTKTLRHCVTINVSLTRPHPRFIQYFMQEITGGQNSLWVGRLRPCSAAENNYEES